MVFIGEERSIQFSHEDSRWEVAAHTESTNPGWTIHRF